MIKIPHEVVAKKKLGQHFLTDIDIAKKIVNSLTSNVSTIVEVGPGMGVLTQYLIQLPEKTIQLIEIDEESVKYLLEKFPHVKNNLHCVDFLKYDLTALTKNSFALIGNFPYNISSQILFKVLAYKNQIPEVVGMFQKEVAQRIASKPGKKDYGILSVLLQAFYDIEYLFTVDENVFNPPPKVKSGVLRLCRNNKKELECDESQFKIVVKTAFNQRRKTLRNSLKALSFKDDFRKESIFDKRPEQLSVNEFIYITLHLIK
jgi:16S rRNA (adenine1518-N6/adenine1519-N6)-dimethyltransferase